MADEIFEEPRQFERVLSRLDALMKRHHVSVDMDAPHSQEVDLRGPETVFMEAMPEASVPVLTEVFHGAELRPVEVVENEAPPILTQLVTEALPLTESMSAEAVQPVFLDTVGLSEVDVEMILHDLMPQLREMMVRVVQEELARSQQTLQARMIFEAEQMLRQRLMQEIRQK